MASGTINGSVGNLNTYFDFYCKWSSTPDTASNTSSVTVTTYWSTTSKYQTFDTVGKRSASITINGSTSSISKVFDCNPWPSGNVYTIQTYTVTVKHNDDGKKKITISAAANGTAASYGPNSCSLSKEVTLDDIPRAASISSAPNFNDEENPVLQYSNPAGTVVTTLQACISLDGSKDDIAYRDISKTGSSYTFSLTSAEREVLRKATTSSNTRTVKFYVKTIIGGNTLYSSVEKTLTIINNKPVFTDSQLSYADTDTSITAVTKNPLMIVQNKSNLKVTYTAAGAKKHATISKYTFTLNGVTKTSTTAGGTVDFGKVNSEQDLTLSVTVTDSRSNTVSATIPITCFKYYAPSVTNFKAYRVKYENGPIDANGTWLKCEYTTNIASVNGTNQRVMHINGVGLESIPITGDVAFIDLQGDSDKTYQVSMTLTDLYSPNNPVSSNVDTVYGSSRIINVHPSGTGIAFGKKAENTNMFECLWDANFIGDVQFQNKSIVDFVYPVGSIYMSVNNIDPKTLFGGTWVQLKDRFLLGVGDTYTNGATGGAATVTLTTAQMPSHTHTFTGSSATTNKTGDHSHSVGRDFDGAYGSSVYTVHSSGTSGAGGTSPTNSTGAHEHTVTAKGSNSETGGGEAHNNMPPYLAVYMWKRTA